MGRLKNNKGRFVNLKIDKLGYHEQKNEVYKLKYWYNNNFRY